MIKQILSAMLILSIVQGQSCVTKLSQVVLNPSTEETKIWGLQDVFFSGAELTYSLSDSTDFNIQGTLTTTDQPQRLLLSNPNILQVAADIIQLNQEWTNNFAILAIAGQAQSNISILWATGNSQNSNISPDFDTQTKIYPESKTIIALDIDYLDSNTVIVDSFDTASNKSLFYVANKNSDYKTYNAQGEIGNTTIRKRINHVHKFPYIGGKTTTYLFRGVPALSGDAQLKGKSIIEVFYIDETNEPYITGDFLDDATLAVISQSDPKNFTFTLVDFKISPNGLIYVLDASMRLYRVQYHTGGQWTYRGMIENQKAQALAFDVHTVLKTGVTRVAILFLDYFIVYQWPLYSETYVSRTLYELDFKVTGKVATFKFSDSYLLIQDAETDILYIYDTEAKQVLTKAQLNAFSIVLVNPQKDITITISSELKQPLQTQTWAISQGNLILNAPQKTRAFKTIVLTATAPDQTVCQAKIGYTQRNRTDWNIYIADPSKTTIPLPFLITYPSNSLFSLAGLATGPNLNYIIQEAKKDTFLSVPSQPILSTYKYWPLNIANQSYPKASDVLFSETLSMENKLSYIQAIQTKDNIVSIWRCKLVEASPQESVCNTLGQFQFSIPLEQQQFSIFAYFGSVLVALRSSPFKIDFVVCDDKICKKVSQIKYEKKSGNEILSFTVQASHIWVVRSNSKIVDIFSAYGSNQFVASINSVQLGQLGLLSAFAPTQIFANKDLNSDLVFINNQDSIIVLSYQSEFSLKKVIPLKLKTPQVYVAVGRETFFLAQADGINSLLSEYSYADMDNIVLQKEHYLYWYTFQMPLQASVSEKNGYLFIRALCTLCSKTFILAFSANTQQRDSLYHAINTEILIPDNSSIIMSVGGDTDMYIYINTGVAHSNNKLLKEPILVINPELPSDSLFSISSLSMNVMNYEFEGKNELNYKQDVRIFNTQTKISIDDASFNKKSNDLFTFKKIEKIQAINIDESWYKGQILQFEIQCPDCQKYIKIRNHLEPQILPFSYAQASDFAGWKENLLVQTADKIYFTHKNQLSQSFITLDKPTAEFTCSLITASDDGQFLVSICSDSKTNYAYISSCIAETDCHPIQTIELQGCIKISKAAMVGMNLIVLDSNWLNPLQYDGSVKVFQLSLDKDEWIANQTHLIDSKFLEIQDKVFVTDFELVPQSASVATMQVMGAKKGFYTVQLDIQGDQITKTLKASTNLLDVMAMNGQFATEDTTFLSIHTFVQNISDFQLNQKIFFTTSNVAHYGLTLYYALTGNGTFALNSSSLDYIVNRYGTWPTLNKVKVSSTHFVIPYGNQETNKVVIAIYEMINVTALTEGTTPILLMKGGSQSQLNAQTYNNFALRFQVGDEKQILTNDINSLNINNQLQITIENGTYVEDQNITIIAKNDFSQISLQTQIKRTNVEGDSSEWKWWYTLLIILGVLLIIGLIGIVVMKNRTEKVDSLNPLDPLLGSVQKKNRSSQ